jgi:hypothetical protein
MGRQQGEFTVTEIGDAPLALHECCGIGSDEYLARTNAEYYLAAFNERRLRQVASRPAPQLHDRRRPAAKPPVTP